MPWRVHAPMHTEKLYTIPRYGCCWPRIVDGILHEQITNKASSEITRSTHRSDGGRKCLSQQNVLLRIYKYYVYRPRSGRLDKEEWNIFTTKKNNTYKHTYPLRVSAAAATDDLYYRNPVLCDRNRRFLCWWVKLAAHPCLLFAADVGLSTFFSLICTIPPPLHSHLFLL